MRIATPPWDGAGPLPLLFARWTVFAVSAQERPARALGHKSVRSQPSLEEDDDREHPTA